MKRFSEQIKKKSDTIRLKAAEKQALRERVVSFMEYHPLPTTLKKQSVSGTAISEPFVQFFIPARFVQAFAALCVMLVVVGVPALAEQAIPGDVLYPVKVRVNEEIRGSLNRTSYEKVAWETERLQRRISEARQLAQAGKLTNAIEEDVLLAVANHKSATEAQIATLSTVDAEGAALAQITFASVLGVQSAVLRANDTGSTTSGMSTAALARALDAGSSEASERGESGTVSYERLVAQLEVETTRSRELLSNIQGVATDQEYKDLERRLGDVERKINDAITQDTTDPGEVIGKLREAWKDTQKLISYMTDIDVRSTISLESLVPMVLTLEERVAELSSKYQATEVNLIRIKAGVDQLKDEGVKEKIELSIPEIETLLLTASTSDVSDLMAAENAVNEAFALTGSILALGTFPRLEENIDNVLENSSTSTGTTTDAATSSVDVGAQAQGGV